MTATPRPGPGALGTRPRSCWTSACQQPTRGIPILIMRNRHRAVSDGGPELKPGREPSQWGAQPGSVLSRHLRNGGVPQDPTVITM